MGRHREFDPEQALDAALDVFWERGYVGTSFEHLSRATGVARPGLYAAFGNKESLFFKALDRYEATYFGFLDEALAAPTSYEVVRRIFEELAKVHTLHGEARGCLGLNGALAASDEVEAVRLELIRRRETLEHRLADRLERARVDGDLPPETDCEALAAYVAAITQGMAVQAKAGAGKPKLDAIVAHALSVWPTPQSS